MWGTLPIPTPWALLMEKWKAALNPSIGVLPCVTTATGALSRAEEHCVEPGL